MKNSKTKYICTSCECSYTQWQGQCHSCREWNTIEQLEFLVSQSRTSHEQRACKVNDVIIEKQKPLNTGFKEFNRVLGGGLTEGSLNLIGGQPGIGKSTLLLELSNRLAVTYKVLYVSGEESCKQIALRAKRLNLKSEKLLILNEVNWINIQKQIKRLSPQFLIIDSIQTTQLDDQSSGSFSGNHIREVTHEIMNFVKSRNLTTFIVGHVTKDGGLAGPKMLEHMVDCVLSFEGNKNEPHRILKSLKNRFGSTQEMGLFEMTSLGLSEVEDHHYFMNLETDVGSSFNCSFEGSRVFPISVQSLLVENVSSSSRVVSEDFSKSRLLLILGIIKKYLSIPMENYDIYLNTAKRYELCARNDDLSVLASLLSSYFNKKLKERYLFLGELSLSGRLVPLSLSQEALLQINCEGFDYLVLDKKTARKYDSIGRTQVIGVESIYEIKDKFF